jgi:hypothetical protein
VPELAQTREVHMSLFDYTTVEPPVHRLPGTPHVRGAKLAVGEMRDGLHHLAAVLANTGWADDHPIGSDEVAIELIDLVSQLGPAECHALRIATAVLVRVAMRNGYHAN